MFESIDNTINNGYSNGIAGDIDDIKDTVEEIKSSVTDNYGYDSIYSMIDEIKSTVDEIQDGISSRY